MGRRLRTNQIYQGDCLDLMQYLPDKSVKGDTVLDFVIGSGTTAIACINLNRNFIGIDLDENYCKIARERISEL